MMTARQRLDLDLSNLKISPLTRAAQLDGFSCGEREIDRHIGMCCGWNEDHRARTYCAFLGDIEAVAGFYTISIAPHAPDHLPEEVTMGSLRHIPFMYINYLGVREDLQGGGVGEALLGHAMDGCARVAQAVGGYGAALIALNARAYNLYYKYGFRAIDSKLKFPFMVMPIRSLLDLYILKSEKQATVSIAQGLSASTHIQFTTTRTSL